MTKSADISRDIEAQLWLKQLRAEYWEEFGVIPPWLELDPSNPVYQWPEICKEC